MQKIWQKIKENRRIADSILILIVAILLSTPLLNEKINVYCEDGRQHLTRAYHTYQSILQNGSGNVISSFTNGFGYSWNLFYGPLSSDFIMILGIVLGNFNLGFKMAIVFIVFLAGLFMYKLVHEMTENPNTALLASVIYMTSPYFFTDLYIRHAMR